MHNRDTIYLLFVYYYFHFQILSVVCFIHSFIYPFIHSFNRKYHTFIFGSKIYLIIYRFYLFIYYFYNFY